MKVMGKDKRVILLYCPSTHGGLAEHLHYQAAALTKLGLPVLVITSKNYLAGRPVPYELRKYLLEAPVFVKSNLIRKMLLLCQMVLNQYLLGFYILVKRPSFILLDSYSEYFSPIWVWPHIFNSKVLRFKYVANIHDPVRDYVVGFLWWHKLSIRLAYIPIKYGLIHAQLPSPSPVPRHVRLAEVPVGVYDVQNKVVHDIAVRNKWGFSSDAKVFLAFGYIRDNKNLDLFLRAQAEFTEVCLVILGTAANSSAKTLDYYKRLARDLGLQNRTFFSDEFIPDSMIYSLFAASDFTLLTYSSSFVSQSGVLNIAAKVKKPILASSGPGPLRDAVIKYKLGVFVEPDSIEEIKRGIELLLRSPLNPEWEKYNEYASWNTNVNRLLELVNYNK